MSTQNPVFGLLLSLFHLAAVSVATTYGFAAFGLPYPGLFYGFGILFAMILIWALFLSPKPVLRTDKFARTFIEMLFIGAGIITGFFLGIPLWIIIPAGILAMVISYFAIIKRGK